MPNGPRSGRQSGRTVTVLGIESTDDVDTQAASKYREETVYKHFRGRLKVVKLRGEKATYDKVQKVVTQRDFDYVTGQGHGNIDTFKGQGNQWIFHVGTYPSKVPAKKIVHFLSCETAKNLGRDFVKKKCRAFFGYDIRFTWDACAPEIFIACDSKIDIALANGRTAGEAYDEAVKEFARRAKELERKGACAKPAALKMICEHLCAPSTGKAWGRKSARLYRPAR